MPFVKAALAGAFVALTMVACSGSQGDECTKDSDCHSNLTCQPIQGRGKTYCCPTPAETSDYTHCHMAK